MSNSPLADQSMTYRAIAPSGKKNYTPGRTVDGTTYNIDTITLHCVWGHLSLKGIASCFQSETRTASSNYGIDDLGRIAMFVPEDSRSWCSDSRANDVRSVTIEMNSDADSYCAMKEDTVNSAVSLCVDICKRNGIRRMHWFPNLVPFPKPKNNDEKTTNENVINVKHQTIGRNEGIFTVHRWFFDKSCPGEYLMSRMEWICNSVNNELEKYYSSQLIIERNGVKNELFNVEYKKDQIRNGIVRLLYVDGCKYVTFNNFRNSEWNSSELPDFSKLTSYNNLYYGDTITANNSYFFRTNVRCNNAYVSDLTNESKTYKKSSVITTYTFPDYTYQIKIEIDYTDRDNRLGYATLRAYARSSIASYIPEAKKYSDWVKINTGEVTATSSSGGIDAYVVGYINNQNKKSSYYDGVFKPQFQVRLGTSQSFWFDFEGYVQKEDLSTCYRGTYPRVQVDVVGVKLSNDSSDIQVNLRADTFTPLDKIIN